MKPDYICDTCNKKFNRYSETFDLRSTCACVAQPAQHARLKKIEGVDPKDICRHYDERRPVWG